LDSERHFPYGGFAGTSTLIALRGLGLRSSLDQKAILESACTVVRRAESDAPAATSLASNLLRYLDQNFERLLGKPSTGYSFIKNFFQGNAEQEQATEKWVAELASLPWLPVLTTSLSEQMPWKGRPWSAFKAADNGINGGKDPLAPVATVCALDFLYITTDNHMLHTIRFVTRAQTSCGRFPTPGLRPIRCTFSTATCSLHYYGKLLVITHC
jgi:hypothetical protein